MAAPIYMWIKDEAGSPIEGSVLIRDDREGSIEVYALEHEIENPIDEHTGNLNGVRRHKAMNITKRIDKSSSELFRSVTDGRTLSEVILNFYEINDEGREVNYYTIQLDNVKICKFETLVPNVKMSESDRLPHLEKFALRYEKMTVTYTEGNRTASDSWKERKVA
jgi:type VI secretion system secreted protein Hcp